MGCGAFWQQVTQLDKALRSLRVHGIGPGFGAYNQLYKIRGRLMSQIGFKLPREVSLLLRLAGLSPGSILLFHDSETGWLTGARVSPGQPVVYRSVSTETAMALLTGGLTHELEVELMAPDDYIGE